MYFGSIARRSVSAENLPLWSIRTCSVSFFDTFSSIQLPRSGMIRQLWVLRSPDSDVGDEIDAGRAVQLADHDPLGTVDDELAAAEHDRNVAEVDLLLDRLLPGEPQPDAKRPAVGEPELAALVGAIPRLAEFVPQVLDLHRPVVALDREDLPQHPLDALILALVRRHVVLQEGVVKPRLDLGQIGDVMAGAAAAEVTDLCGLETADGASCH